MPGWRVIVDGHAHHDVDEHLAARDDLGWLPITVNAWVVSGHAWRSVIAAAT